MQRHAGFTLLEVMLVLLLFSGIALLAVATQPAASTRPEAEKLLVMMRWAAGQAQLDGAVIRLQLNPHRVDLARLAPGKTSGDSLFYGYHWQPIKNRLARFRLPGNMSFTLRQQGKVMTLPATLLFLPDGDQPPFTLQLNGADLTGSEIGAAEGELVLRELP
ncbi:prepilin-type N-terminal cleavage/methylation domain-containing protein [Erwinia amylovora]|uniref:Type II secretion system protein outH n=4 Tax=Erwinia amylovora TaxID=552 RepID=A0A831ES30_ERWAM|nr:prepilin-type N-terminal cleavage/methylation domain-containing protein [Erwinia amylovora]CBX81757.1 Type II secretion system protein outH [Erwinia amylovora ATCC BAA-2158]CCP04146.1 Type II secretion system protein outH [Erwinia amylovora Ea644]CCP08215.1 Type II secretion system protein outH [Erwinia amylovora MR1]CDK16243.1 Type II secretion system protein outH [Erwinia amylovora LA635]CDK19609.1 Type II secretion system protein outH [Erwinia amylovora LA636]CDK22981.1 Type II secretio